MSTQFKATTNSADETQDLAANMATILTTGDLLVLLGDLGAGKTCFTQGLARGLDIAERVTSPTFTLVNHYEGRLKLHHLDVYRVAGFSDSLDLDLHEMAENGVTVIEWGHNISDALASSRLEIELKYDDASDDARTFILTAFGESWPSRLASMSDLLKPWQIS